VALSLNVIARIVSGCKLLASSIFQYISLPDLYNLLHCSVIPGIRASGMAIFESFIVASSSIDPLFASDSLKLCKFVLQMDEGESSWRSLLVIRTIAVKGFHCSILDLGIAPYLNLHLNSAHNGCVIAAISTIIEILRSDLPFEEIDVMKVISLMSNANEEICDQSCKLISAYLLK
jgi:hypothetical protein